MVFLRSQRHPKGCLCDLVSKEIKPAGRWQKAEPGGYFYMRLQLTGTQGASLCTTKGYIPDMEGGMLKGEMKYEHYKSCPWCTILDWPPG